MNWLLLAALTVGLGVATPVAQGARSVDIDANPRRHIRFVSTRIAAAFQLALDRSTAFGAAVERIESSDCYVYFDEGRCHTGGIGSCLRILTARPYARYLRIEIDS